MLQVFIFNGDHMLPEMVLQGGLFHEHLQLVNVGVALLEALDLGPDGS